MPWGLSGEPPPTTTESPPPELKWPYPDRYFDGQRSPSLIVKLQRGVALEVRGVGWIVLQVIEMEPVMAVTLAL